MSRIDYYNRIFSAYLTHNKSHLTFWHDIPQINENFDADKIGEYYMHFFVKADFAGHFDNDGIPMLDYRGAIGLQYNPIAIAQYGLGNYNLYRLKGEQSRKLKFLKAGDWLINNLEKTSHGTKVWYHHFDWEYRNTLKAPWYSALSQGQGLSLLVRAHKETGNNLYIEAATEAFLSFKNDLKQGGVTYTDSRGHIWFEETIVDPPTHILNGFIWAIWGVYDYLLYTGLDEAKLLFNEAVRTLKNNLYQFDAGFWSLYEQSATCMKMIASPFYHDLHIVQLRVMYSLTKEQVFKHFADKWDGYRKNAIKKTAAIIYKSLFKLFYY